MLSDPVAEAFGLIHRHPSGENFWYGSIRLIIYSFLSLGDPLLQLRTDDDKTAMDLARSSDAKKILESACRISENNTKMTRGRTSNKKTGSVPQKSAEEYLLLLSILLKNHLLDSKQISSVTNESRPNLTDLNSYYKMLERHVKAMCNNRLSKSIRNSLRLIKIYLPCLCNKKQENILDSRSIKSANEE